MNEDIKIINSKRGMALYNSTKGDMDLPWAGTPTAMSKCKIVYLFKNIYLPNYVWTTLKKIYYRKMSRYTCNDWNKSYLVEKLIKEKINKKKINITVRPLAPSLRSESIKSGYFSKYKYIFLFLEYWEITYLIFETS